ncbi:MAG: tRNA epoxyqueuosine(34) reductase QueG [Proteobacteria bacterium]|nr:tRNA epoxyqueuosine(34) reductase QueG [Pseudomonadota bacterium]
MDETTRKVKAMALEAGFDLAGVSGIRLPAAHGQRLGRWLSLGYNGGMESMREHFSRRLDPRMLAPRARSVLCLAIHYYTPDEPMPEDDRVYGRVARYARGRDYHHLARERMEALIRALDQAFPGHGHMPAVDSSPILERAYAQEAGLGFLGKNGALITREFGSWVVLCEFLTSLELAPGAPVEDRCGDCSLCLSACPTGALVEPGLLDARRCLSYLSTVHSGEISPAQSRLLGDRLLGCDACQEACPHNGNAATTRHLDAWNQGAWMDLSLVLETPSEKRFAKRFAQTPLAHARRKRLERNARAIQENFQLSSKVRS